MAIGIEAQLPPEVILGGLPVFGLSCCSLAHECNFNVLSSGHCRERYRYDREPLMSMQQIQQSEHSQKRQRYDQEQMLYMQQLQSQQKTYHQNFCSVSGFQDGVKETMQKNSNFAVGSDWHIEEIDQYLKLQSERLKWLLKEQRQRLEAALLRKIESRAQSLIQQKDQEIAHASQKTVELQTLLTKLEEESQTWQRLAQENEAMVVSLNNTLERLREDVESRCEAANRGAEVRKGESRGAADEEEEKIVCRVCNSGASCMLFLPCRHLCSCKSCNLILKHCPVCGTAKKASIEALTSS